MDIYRYLGKSFQCELCGNTHTIPVKTIEKGDITQLCQFIYSLLPDTKDLCFLTDDVVWEVMGKRCKDVLDAHFGVIPHILYPSGEKRVTARQEYMDGILAASEKTDAIITAGTGTITDLGKYAGDILNKPVIALPSAPSMNAYTSGVAAVIKDGVKHTFSVRPAEGVLIDERVILKSPLELIKAGFADSSAKAFANADWKLSSIVTGESFCGLPLKIVGAAEKRYMDRGDLLLKRDKEVIGCLMDGLNLGGISMLIAGKSSPASGGEHLISHFLDMYAHQHKRETFAYHGLQVGTGVYISSVIYDCLSNLSSSEVEKMIQGSEVGYGDKLYQLQALFPSSVGIIKEEFVKKIELDKRIGEILPEKWDRIRRDVFHMVYRPDEVKKFLDSAGCPVSLRDIGVNKDLAVKVITLSRFIRERLVILDIADRLGILEDIAEHLY